MKAALNTRLAYVITGVADVDAMSKAGLTGLGLWLKARTSYEPEAPMGVDLAKDDLSFFPLHLLADGSARKGPFARSALQGAGLYAQRRHASDRHPRSDAGALTRGAKQSRRTDAAQRLLGKLDLPPLEPVPSDHVLTKAFYLLSQLSRPLGRRQGLGAGLAARRSRPRTRARARRRRRVARHHRQQ